MTNEIVLHPICNLFPPMSEEEFAELKENIRVNGVKTPVAFWRGQLIDGRNRVRAMQELGIDPMDYAGELLNDEDPISWAIANNLHRRHLTPSQKAMVANRLAIMRAGNQPESNGGIPPFTQQQAAELVGVSRDSVKQARALERTAAPEVVEAVHSGTVTLNAATELAKAEPDKAKQAAIVAGGKQAVKEVIAAKKAVPPKQVEQGADDNHDTSNTSSPQRGIGAVEALKQLLKVAGKNDIVRRRIKTQVALIREFPAQHRHLIRQFVVETTASDSGAIIAADAWMQENETD